jgi:hypothetical protein
METELLNPAIKLTEPEPAILYTAKNMLSDADFHTFKYLVSALEGTPISPATFVFYGPPRSGKSFLMNKLNISRDDRVAWSPDWSSIFSECYIYNKFHNDFDFEGLKHISGHKIVIIHLTAREGELEKLRNQSVGRDVHVINFNKLY